MKLKLVKKKAKWVEGEDEFDMAVEFQLEPDHDDPEDVKAVNHLRNVLFYCAKGVDYAGRKGGTDDCVGTLRFKINVEQEGTDHV